MCFKITLWPVLCASEKGNIHFFNCQFCPSLKLSWVATVVFNVRLLHAFVLSKKLPWLAQTNVITLKRKNNWKQLSKFSFTYSENVNQIKVIIISIEFIQYNRILIIETFLSELKSLQITHENVCQCKKKWKKDKEMT